MLLRRLPKLKNSRVTRAPVGLVGTRAAEAERVLRLPRYIEQRGYTSVGHSQRILVPEAIAFHTPGLTPRSSRAVSSAASATAGVQKNKKESKVSGWTLAWLWDQVLHIYHGFRLLGVNVGVTMRLRRQMSNGQTLTRRERQLLQATTEDLLRLVPFSLFILIPGGELLLPVAISLFPNLMPSTFDTTESRRRRHIMDNLTSGVSRRRLFEHMTMRILLHENFSATSKSLNLFRVCVDGGVVDEQAIRSLLPYFHKDGPLALKKLPKYVLRDLCVLAGIMSMKRMRLENTILPDGMMEARLRHLLDSELKRREEDDRCMDSTNIAKMTFQELEHECARRKIRWIGPPEALQQQLQQWLSLSLDPEVPDHLLLFLFPNATESDVMLSCLTKDEQDHILGLAKFKDTTQYRLLRNVTKKAAKKSQSEINKNRIMEEDIDEMKGHIEDVRQENKATDCEFAEMREALKTVTDEELLNYFDLLVANPDLQACQIDGECGIDAGKSAEAMVEVLRRRGVTIAKELAERSLREFDLDESDVISHGEFVGLVKRIRHVS